MGGWPWGRSQTSHKALCCPETHKALGHRMDFSLRFSGACCTKWMLTRDLLQMVCVRGLRMSAGAGAGNKGNKWNRDRVCGMCMHCCKVRHRTERTLASDRVMVMHCIVACLGVQAGGPVDAVALCKGETTVVT